ncbi:Mu transposase domain-containing protein [Palaeococcus sp. (in: euryarchaeotes)]
MEGLVGFTRRNYMVPVPEAESIEALNEMILKRCYTYGNHTISGRHGTVNELYEEEKKHLLDLPEVPFSNVEVCNGRVDKYSTVTLDKNRYSVPTHYSAFRLKPEHYLDFIRK